MSLWGFPRNSPITVASVLEARLLELLSAPLRSGILYLQVYFLLFINLPPSLMLGFFFSKIIGVSCLSHLNVTTERKTPCLHYWAWVGLCSVVSAGAQVHAGKLCRAGELKGPLVRNMCPGLSQCACSACSRRATRGYCRSCFFKLICLPSMQLCVKLLNLLSRTFPGDGSTSTMNWKIPEQWEWAWIWYPSLV